MQKMSCCGITLNALQLEFLVALVAVETETYHCAMFELVQDATTTELLLGLVLLFALTVWIETSNVQKKSTLSRRVPGKCSK